MLLLTGSLNPAAGLTVGGGAFVYAASATQAASGLTVNAGASTINAGAGTLALGPIARSVGGTIDLPATTGAVATTASNTNGILGPWAFAGSGSSTAYATIANGTIGAYSGATSANNNSSSWGGVPAGGSGTTNYRITANGNWPQTATATNVNTIQYAGIGGTQTSSSTGTYLAANGIINTGTGPLVIGGGAIALNVQAGSGQELVIGTFTAGITINNSIEDSTAGASILTKVGSGVLTLAGSNNYTGGTYLDAGSISISSNTSLGGTSGTAGAVTLAGGNLSVTTGFTNTHPFTPAASGGTISVDSAAQLYMHTANTILGSGPLTISGTGTLVTPVAGVGNFRVDVSNPYSGNVMVQSGGIFEAGTSVPVATTAIFTLGSQGEINVDSGCVLANNVTVSGGANSVLSFGSYPSGTGGTYSGTINLTTNGVVRMQNWYNTGALQGTILGQVTGNGALSVDSGTNVGLANAGALALGNSSNNYSGGTAISNAIVLVGAQSIGAGGATIASEAGARLGSRDGQ